MEFDSYDDAFQAILPYENLIGIFYEPLEKSIRDVFIGRSDPIISQDIYLGKKGILPPFKYLPRDLEDIQFWTGFDDNIIVPLGEVLKDELLSGYFKDGELTKDVIISGTDWTNPIRIPRGLGFRMNFKTYGNIEFQIIERDENGTRFIGYLDTSYELSNMKKALLYFRQGENNAPPVEISLLFLAR
jgi:hypothetical protein